MHASVNIVTNKIRDTKRGSDTCEQNTYPISVVDCYCLMAHRRYYVLLLSFVSFRFYILPCLLQTSSKRLNLLYARTKNFIPYSYGPCIICSTREETSRSQRAVSILVAKLVATNALYFVQKSRYHRISLEKIPFFAWFPLIPSASFVRLILYCNEKPVSELRDQRNYLHGTAYKLTYGAIEEDR